MTRALSEIKPALTRSALAEQHARAVFAAIEPIGAALVDDVRFFTERRSRYCGRVRAAAIFVICETTVATNAAVGRVVGRSAMHIARMVREFDAHRSAAELAAFRRVAQRVPLPSAAPTRRWTPELDRALRQAWQWTDKTETEIAAQLEVDPDEMRSRADRLGLGADVWPVLDEARG